MRQIFVFAAIVVVGGVYVARLADRTLERPPPQVAAAQPAARLPEAASEGRTLTVAADRHGHFEIAARVD